MSVLHLLWLFLLWLILTDFLYRGKLTFHLLFGKIHLKQLTLLGNDPKMNQGGGWLRFQVGSLIYHGHYHNRI